MHISDIILALNSATGPSRQLDAYIAEAIDPNLAGIKWDRGEPYFVNRSNSPAGGRVWKYTSSMDSAARILPSGWQLDEFYKVDRNTKYEVCVRREWTVVISKSSTLPLAICVSALRARLVHSAVYN